MVKRQTPFLDHRRQLSGQREPSRGVVPVRGQNDPVVPPEADRLSGHTDRHRRRLFTPYQREHRISAVSAQGYRRLTADPQMIPDLPGRCNGVTDTDDPPMFLAHQGIVDAQAAVGGHREAAALRQVRHVERARPYRAIAGQPAGVGLDGVGADSGNARSGTQSNAGVRELAFDSHSARLGQPCCDRLRHQIDIQSRLPVGDFGGSLDPGQSATDHHDTRPRRQVPQSQAQRLGAVEVGDTVRILGPGQTSGSRTSHRVQQMVEIECTTVVEFAPNAQRSWRPRPPAIAHHGAIVRSAAAPRSTHPPRARATRHAPRIPAED